MVLFQIRTSAPRLSPSPPARPTCRSSPPGSPRPRRPRRRPPCGRAATRARPRRAKPVDRRASPRLVRDASVGSEPARGPAAPARRRVPPPRASRGARSDATWHRARRLSPGGRTGWRRGQVDRRRRGDAAVAVADEARFPPDSSRWPNSSTRRRTSRSTPSPWPGLAAVAPAAAFATGNLGVATNALPRRYREPAHGTAAVVEAMIRRIRRRRSPKAGRAPRRRAKRGGGSRSTEMACAPSSPSCASPTRGRRGGGETRDQALLAAAPRRRRRSTQAWHASTRRRASFRRFGRREAGERKDGRLGTRAVSARTWTSRPNAPNATFRRV